MSDLNESVNDVKKRSKKSYSRRFYNIKDVPRRSFPNFNITTRESTRLPEAEQVQSVAWNAEQLTEVESSDKILTICPYILDSDPPDMRLVTVAAFALKKHGIALAVDQPNGIMFVDRSAVAKVMRKFPVLIDNPELDLVILSSILVKEGHRVANIVVDMELETIGFYQIFDKSIWRKILRL